MATMTAVTGAPAMRRRSAGASPRDDPAVGRTVVPLTACYFRRLLARGQGIDAGIAAGEQAGGHRPAGPAVAVPAGRQPMLPAHSPRNRQGGTARPHLRG